MSNLLLLIPIALFLGLLGLGAFLWSLRSGQFDDMEGAANRILFDDEDEKISPKTKKFQHRDS
ncbi:MAG: cbb3-type cytochrome oxidase assembly protein CcoS [Porticoccaceae bacterium]|jgi:cbb3-type cytochrome oxidase maturation protein|uniref:cbb3-type cytochrome oxidase assembly protein CcoS n=1 Tax=Thalassospira sp. TaxID=1912094 RepID=UPI003A84FC41